MVLPCSTNSPKYMNMELSDIRAACDMLCVTTMIVKSFLSCNNNSSILFVDMGSSAEVGSSINKISGFNANVRAMHNRCCCPPDKKEPRFVITSFTSSQSATLCKLCSTMLSFSRFRKRIPLSSSQPAHYRKYSWLERVGLLKYHPYKASHFHGIHLQHVLPFK